MSKEEWKTIEAHLSLSPSQADRFDVLAATGNTSDGTQSLEYIELENTVNSAMGEYAKTDAEMLKKQGEGALLRKLTDSQKSIFDDSAVVNVLDEELNKEPSSSLTHQDRATMIAVSDKLKDISAKSSSVRMQSLLNALGNEDKFSRLVRAQNGYRMDGNLSPGDKAEIKRLQESLAQSFHVSAGNKDMLMRKQVAIGINGEEKNAGRMMTVEELLDGKFEKGGFKINRDKKTGQELQTYLKHFID